MSHDIERQLLVLSPEEIRELEQNGIDGEQLEPVLREAAALCVESQSALASSLAMEQPRTRTADVLARRGRRWRWRLLLLLVFVPMIVIGLLLFGTAIAALVTAFLWR